MIPFNQFEGSIAKLGPMSGLLFGSLLWTMIGNVELLSRAETIQCYRGHHAPPPALGTTSQSERGTPAPDQSEAAPDLTRVPLMAGIVTSPDMIYCIIVWSEAPIITLFDNVM